RIGQELKKILNKNIKILNLSDCNISTNVVKVLKKALRTNDTFINLDLSCSLNMLIEIYLLR
ncbi:6882_t:CDS:1, partial [Scutellospora calospora]